MNKKAAIPIIGWIIIAVISLLLANQFGIFSIFTPSVGQPSGGESLVNLIYYQNAISNPTYACSSIQQCTQEEWYCPYSGSIPCSNRALFSTQSSCQSSTQWCVGKTSTPCQLSCSFQSQSCTNTPIKDNGN